MTFVQLFFLHTLWVVARAASTTTTELSTSLETSTSTTETTTLSSSTASSSVTTAPTSPSTTTGGSGSSPTSASSSSTTVTSTATSTPTSMISSTSTTPGSTATTITNIPTTVTTITTIPTTVTTTTAATTTTAPPWDRSKFVSGSCNDWFLYCTELNVTTKTPEDYCPSFVKSKDCVNGSSSSCNNTEFNILDTLTCGPSNALNNTVYSHCLGVITDCLPGSVEQADVVKANFQFNTLFCGVVNKIKPCAIKVNCTETDFKEVRKITGCSTASRVMALLPLNLPVIFLVLRMTARG